MDFEKIINYVEENKEEYFNKMMAEKAALHISKAGHLVVLTGAGISTESGIPDYRSHGGLWDGLKPEEISHWSKIGTPEFRKFFSERHMEFQEHSPNIAHEILAKWQENQKVTIVTQNIDGYHQKAGAKDVIEVHGHMRWLECTECQTKHDFGQYTVFDNDSCCICGGTIHGGILRPPVVLFGESVPALEWHKALMAVQSADIILVLGTSLQVAPFNTLIDEALMNSSARLIIVTKSETPYDGLASVRIYEGIGETMKKIDEALTSI